jgi:hypothetical protein
MDCQPSIPIGFGGPFLDRPEKFPVGFAINILPNLSVLSQFVYLMAKSGQQKRQTNSQLPWSTAIRVGAKFS